MVNVGLSPGNINSDARNFSMPREESRHRRDSDLRACARLVRAQRAARNGPIAERVTLLAAQRFRGDRSLNIEA
jgi:hypothetical protein